MANYGHLWPLLATGIDAISEVPRARWDADALYDPDFERRGTATTRWGGFISNIDQFDPGAFGITPREAAVMDPQHRLLLRCAWHALEDAGLRRELIAGTRSGVYVAQYQNDYGHLALSDREQIDAYTASGTHHGIAANRLSYWLDLRGPSLVVDTACSSSLVAVHLAIRALRRREIDYAIVAGVNLMIGPEETIALSRWGVMAADGRCKSFDHRADGFVRGEGVVTLVLARTEDASAAGLRVRAELLGSAVNQDGRSNGLTAPSGLAQQAVVREALRDAKLEPEAVTMIEAHGTGTALGDPIEVEALAAVYGPGAMPCTITTIKSKIGHLEAAAGLAGLAEAVACIEQREVAATLHLERINPAIDLSNTRLRIAREPVAWTGRRIAGVSAFGMGGTNAHVIVAAPSEGADEASGASSSSARPGPALALLPLSAEGHEGLLALVDAWIAWLRERPPSDPAEPICAAATRQRSALRDRMFVVGRDVAELLAELERWRAQPEPSATRARRGPAFVVPGQGGQWLGMGRSLYASEPAFRAALDRCAALVADHGGPALVAELHAEAPRLGAIEVVQPLLFSLSIAYAALWRSVGLEPAALVGHSMGEAAAAAISGALSLDDAAWIIVERSRQMARLRGRGAMLVVELDADALGPWLVEDLKLAAINGPETCVVSGSLAAIEALEQRAADAEVETRRVDVEVASHHAGMDALRESLVASLARVAPRPARLAMISTVTGEPVAGAELDAEYWFRNLRQPVRLWPVVDALLAAGTRDFVELGPHPVLLPALRSGLAARAIEGATIPSSRRASERGGELRAWLEALGQLWARGHGVELGARLATVARAHLDLPRYPFVERRYWLAATTTSLARSRAGRARVQLAEDLDAWFHALDWDPLAEIAVLEPGPPRRPVLVGDGPTSRALELALTELGAEPVRVEGVAALEHWRAAQAGSDPVEVTAVVAELVPGLGPGRRASEVIADVALELGALARMAEAEGWRARLLTRGGAPALAARVPLEAACFGLARVLSVEHAGACAAILDLDPEAGEAAAARAGALVLGAVAPEPVDAVRGSSCLGLRLRAAPLEPAELGPLDPGATYMVAGGLGGLGLHISRWLVERGARHLLLIGRRALPARAEWSASEDPRVSALQMLERGGAAVHHRVCDLGEGGALDRVLGAWTAEARPPVRGVIHAAGVQDHAALVELDRRELLAGLGAKVEGSEACVGLPELEFVVLCSSAATMLRSPLLATYVAACSYQDALAEQARGCGSPVSAIGWGVWATGMTARFAAATGRSVPGFAAMDVDSALAAMERCVVAGVGHRGVMKVDWARWAGDHGSEAATPTMAGLVEPRADAAIGAAHFDREAILAAAGEPRRALVRAQLFACLAAIARLRPEDLDPDRSAAAHGLDSLMAVELRNQLRGSLGVTVAIAELLRSPSLATLADHVAKLVDAELDDAAVDAQSDEWDSLTL